MKKCPKCNQIYFDNNQNFCLNDGETLIFSNDSQPTLIVDSKQYSQSPKVPEKQGVSPIFAYLSIGLLCLLVGGGIVALILINPFSRANKEQESVAVNQKTVENASIANKAVENQQNSAAFQPTQTPVIVKVPVSTPKSKSFGYKNYAGNIGGDSASFDLVWNNDKTISGTYYLTSNPNVRYNVSGSNFVDGVSDIRVSQGSNFIGQVKLTKTLEGNILCWQGTLSGGNQYMRFCRKR